MGKQKAIKRHATNGVPKDTAVRLARDFLARHGGGLDDLVERFPGMHGPALRRSIDKHLSRSTATRELITALDEAVVVLLSLQNKECLVLQADADRHLQVDAGIRWYAARFHDLAQAARRM